MSIVLHFKSPHQVIEANRTLFKVAVCVTVLILAAIFGSQASLLWLGLLAVGMGVLFLLRRPLLGLLALVPAALVIPIQFGTGTDVSLNLASLLVPTLLVLWLLDMARRRSFRVVHTRTNKPLFFFLLAGLLSLLISNVVWDPVVPRSNHFILVQIAQWALFAFSAGAFWLMGNLVRDEVWLHRLTVLFLVIAGGLAVIIVLSGGANLVQRGVATLAVARAPLWMLMGGLAGGQLLFNEKLSSGWRLCLLVILGAVFANAFHFQRATVSYAASVLPVTGTLAWLRWPSLRWLVITLIVILTATGYLFSGVYELAGGEAEWEESGGSRIALIGRVVEVTMRNPVTGLGPAAYRNYARMKWLPYGKALWLDPKINSHNNYIDLFSYVGVVGLGLFLWFAVEVLCLGLRLRTHFTHGFAAGYVNAMLAAWVTALLLMVMNDWILPSVYNVGFPGFQASVLVWLFLGGLVALDNMASGKMPVEVDHAT